jgi:hypothetical protein
MSSVLRAQWSGRLPAEWKGQASVYSQTNLILHDLKLHSSLCHKFLSTAGLLVSELSLFNISQPVNSHQLMPTFQCT